MRNNLLYSLLTAILVIILFAICSLPIFKGLITSFEYKSYDLRHNIGINPKKPSSDIVILAIDDNSLELLENKYGRWPWNRGAYADAINTLEKYGVKQIILDLMFIGKSQDKLADIRLIQAIKKNENVFAGINFDYRKTSKTLPENLAVAIDDKSNITFPVYKGFRPVLKEIMKTGRVGVLNCQRDFDGISRRTPTLLKLQGKYYPYLGFKAIMNHYGVEKIIINKKNKLLINNKKMKLSDNGYVTLNWYQDKFKVIPFWKLDKAQDELRDKTVFVGITASSLYDIKSTPISRNMSGIELQATMFNNFLENNFIKQSSTFATLAVSIALCIIVALAAINWQTTLASISLSLALIMGYMISSVVLLKYFNYWIDVVFVVFAIIATFIGAYIIKYKNKSKDFEYTYKLATTDGLTGLYNHRFFQEQMNICLENAKRYETDFSLLLIDIDFFKKFNDNYGHQAGDAVLKQVAQLLKKSVRATDIVARYGGEEMAIILPNTDYENAFITAEKICNQVATTPFFLNAKTTKSVTISLGVATYPEHGKTPADLIEYADKGLYAAKENGRNQVGKVFDI